MCSEEQNQSLLVIPDPPHWKAFASGKDLVHILDQVLSTASVMVPHVHRAKTFASRSKKSIPFFTCVHTHTHIQQWQ